MNTKTLKAMNYWSIKEHCIKESKKYKTINELKKNSSGCYASILKHSWETECFPNFIKRKPNGYWNDKEKCIEEAKKYCNLREFSKKSYAAYHSSKKHNWIDEIASLYDKITHYPSLEEHIHSVYVYEFKNEMTCYIGRTNNIKRRHQQHIKDKKDTLNRYCLSKNIPIPNCIILKEKLNAKESQFFEDYFLKEYINNGWTALNIAKTGINKGSLGASQKWTYEECSKESKKYSSITEFGLNNQSAYNACKKNGWTYDFFKSSKKSDRYWNNYENCKKAFNKCQNARELIKNYGGCYNAIKRNHFDDLKFSKNKN